MNEKQKKLLEDNGYILDTRSQKHPYVLNADYFKFMLRMKDKKIIKHLFIKDINKIDYSINDLALMGDELKEFKELCKKLYDLMKEG